MNPSYLETREVHKKGKVGEPTQLLCLQHLVIGGALLEHSEVFHVLDQGGRAQSNTQSRGKAIPTHTVYCKNRILIEIKGKEI